MTTPITTDPIDLQIARLEARQQELRDVYMAEVVDAPTVDLPPGMEFELLSTALHQLSRGVPTGADSSPVILECRRRVALMEALLVEHKQIQEKLEPLRLAKQKEVQRLVQQPYVLTPTQFAKGMACLLLAAGAFVGAGAGIDAMLGNSRTFGARHLAALGAGYVVCLGLGEARRIRRQPTTNQEVKA
jgi:hypothetical protein